MNEEIAEYLWDCPRCETRGILGRYTSCTNCGASVPDTDCYYPPPDDAPAVRDPGLLRMAHAGENLRCVHCDGILRTSDGTCPRCASAESVSGRRQPRTVRIKPDDRRQEEIAARARRHADARRRRMVVVGGALSFVLLLVAFLVWGFRSHQDTGTVIARSWARAVTVQTWTQTTKSGWRDHERLVETPHADPPGERAGTENIRGCQRKVRTTHREVTGSHRVCTTGASDWVNIGGRLVDLVVSPAEAGNFHNGFGSRPTSSPTVRPSAPRSSPSAPRTSSPARPAVHTPTTRCTTVTDYRSVDDYDDRCTFDVWVWTDGATLTKTGKDAEAPAWPAVSPNAMQRLRRSESYVVTLQYDRTHTWSKDVGADEFARWPMGQKTTLTVNNFGSVSE